MHQSWLDLDPDYINLHNMQIAFHFSAHFNLIDSDNYQQGHDFFLLHSRRSREIWRKTMLSKVEVSHSRLLYEHSSVHYKIPDIYKTGYLFLNNDFPLPDLLLAYPFV